MNRTTIRSSNLHYFVGLAIFMALSWFSTARAREILVTKDNVAEAVKSFRAQVVSPHDFRSLRSWRRTNKVAPIFVNTAWLRASQNRLSFDRVQSKANEIFLKKKMKWNGSRLTKDLPSHKGRSLFSKLEAIPVVIMPDGSLAIIDGHHEVGVALLARSKKMPVKIIDDLSKKFSSNDEAWADLAARKLAYFSNLDGTFSTEPADYHDLQDDPNRMWLSVASRRVDLQQTSSKSFRLQSKMSLYDLWVKVGKGIPFIEFMLADILYKYNLIFRADMTPRELAVFLEKSRSAFAREKSLGNEVLRQVVLISEPVTKAQLGHDPNLYLAKLITGAANVKDRGWSKGRPEDVIAVTTKAQHAAAWAEIAYLLYDSGFCYVPDGSNSGSNSLAAVVVAKVRGLLTAARGRIRGSTGIKLDFAVTKKSAGSEKTAVGQSVVGAAREQITGCNEKLGRLKN